MVDTNKIDLQTVKNTFDKKQHQYKHKHHRQVINSDSDEDAADIFGYRKDVIKTSLIWLIYILTLGLLRLFFHWYPYLKLFSTHARCNLKNAEKILVVDKYKDKYRMYFVEDVKLITSSSRFETAKRNGPPHSTERVACETINYTLTSGRKEMEQIRAFWFKKMCYIWDEDTDCFQKLVGLDNTIKKVELHGFKGYSSAQQSSRRIVYGNNEIDVPLESIFKLFLLEALTPFYIFQVFSLIVWFAEAYYYYTIAIIIMSIYGISSSIIQTRKNQANLKGTVHSSDKANVCRGGNVYEEVTTTHLVPGDLIEIPRHGCVMHCDAVLLNGNCIVNESTLTGESVPVLKTALSKSEAMYKTKDDDLNTLFCGTTVIQGRYYGEEKILAVVLRTGFLTSKGQLVRSIMYPPPADFKFDQDSYKFIGILAIIATLGFIYTVVSKSYKNIAATDIIIKALDLITIVIPPALPAAMTVGKLYALNRLKKKNIYCINSRIINVSGSINCICFDKTGTLTEDGLDMWGIIPVEDCSLQNPMKNAELLDEKSRLLRGMVTCHSLTLIDDKLTGDPLDVKMFESTGWILKEPNVEDTTKYDLLVPTIVKPAKPQSKESLNTANIQDGDLPLEIGIVHQFQFSSTLQRMSVITKTLGSASFDLYCKGAPEMIMSLSKPETIPLNVLDKLREYTEQGYRVIAVGNKVLEDVNLVAIEKMHREDVECELDFVGLVILENRLKPQTTSVIRTLKNSGMKIVMITGDNIQTAISVAKECGIVEHGSTVIDVTTENVEKIGTLTFGTIDNRITTFDSTDHPYANSDIEKSNKNRVHLAISGRSWATIRHYFPHEIPKLILKGTVFARMSSDQKQQLIVELQNIGYYVAMCGDGTNDCGALKAAHVGISLSEAESSVASPFTSKEPNISCVPEVVKEGRAALVTSFGVFKFMLCYSLTEFISVIILYGIDSNLTSLQFLFIDIFLALNFASIFGLTEAYDKRLVKKAPTTSLLGFTPLMSLIFHIFTVIVFQVISYYVIQSYHWFVPFVYEVERGNYFTSYENYTIFTTSMFQYIIMAVIFSKGKPYRKPMFSNRYLITSMILTLVVCCYITLSPAKWILDVLEMVLPPFYDARLMILLIAVINFFVAFVIEEVVVDYLLDRKVKPKFSNLEKSRKKYLKILADLNTSNWPLDQNKSVAQFEVVDELNGPGFKNKEQNGVSIGEFGVGNELNGLGVKNNGQNGILNGGFDGFDDHTITKL